MLRSTDRARLREQVDKSYDAVAQRGEELCHPRGYLSKRVDARECVVIPQGVWSCVTVFVLETHLVLIFPGSASLVLQVIGDVVTTSSIESIDNTSNAWDVARAWRLRRVKRVNNG